MRIFYKAGNQNWNEQKRNYKCYQASFIHANLAFRNAQIKGMFPHHEYGKQGINNRKEQYGVGFVYDWLMFRGKTGK